MSMPVVTEKKVEHQNLGNEPDKENKKEPRVELSL